MRSIRDNQRLVGNLGTTCRTDFYEIEAGLLLEGFCAAQGWGEYRPRASFTLGGFSGGGHRQSERVANTNTSAAPPGSLASATMELSGKQLVFAGTGDRALIGPRERLTSGGTPPKDWIGWGGTLGVAVH